VPPEGVLDDRLESGVLRLPAQDLARLLRIGYQEAGRDMARLMVSLVQYMGLTDVNTVGATGVTGPLTSLFG